MPRQGFWEGHRSSGTSSLGEDPDHCTPDFLTPLQASGHNPPLVRQAEAQLIHPHTGFC